MGICAVHPASFFCQFVLLSLCLSFLQTPHYTSLFLSQPVSHIQPLSLPASLFASALQLCSFNILANLLLLFSSYYKLYQFYREAATCWSLGSTSTKTHSIHLSTPQPHPSLPTVVTVIIAPAPAILCSITVSKRLGLSIALMTTALFSMTVWVAGEV